MSLVPLAKSVRCPACKELILNMKQHLIDKHPIIVAYHLNLKMTELLKESMKLFKESEMKWEC